MRIAYPCPNVSWNMLIKGTWVCIYQQIKPNPTPDLSMHSRSLTDIWIPALRWDVSLPFDLYKENPYAWENNLHDEAGTMLCASYQRYS